MRLTALHPKIPVEVIEASKKSGIATVEEIFLTTADDLYRKLSSDNISIQQIKELKVEVGRRLSAPGIRAKEFFVDQRNKELQRENCYSDVESINRLLGGFGKYGIIEIAGSKGSGRSGFALNVTLRYMASHPLQKTLWFDIGGEFDIERTYRIAGLHANPTETEAVLDNFNVVPCFEVAHVYEYIRDLENLLGKQPHDSRTRFIVIDSMTPLLAPLLSSGSSQGHAIMTALMRRLASLARTYSLTVLTINDAVRLQDEKTSTYVLTPSLGPSFTFLTDDTLWLSVADDRVSEKQREELISSGKKLYMIKVLRSRNDHSQGDWCYFTMKDGISMGDWRPTPLLHSNENV